jgi:hypothetical protein
VSFDTYPVRPGAKPARRGAAGAGEYHRVAVAGTGDTCRAGATPVAQGRPARRALARTGRAAAALMALALLAGPAAGPAAADSVRDLAGARPARGVIPSHFVGYSIEWSLVERYMGPAARPAFTNLLRNLGSGILRIGGGSQDHMPFDPAAANTIQIITPDDLGAIRATVDAADAAGGKGGVPSWGTSLGTAMAPPDAERPWITPEHARAFTQQGVVPAFAGAEREVVGIGLGNEPDISYRYDVARYLADLETYSKAGVTRPFPAVAPSTSEPVAAWSAIEARAVPTRLFWEWPAILDAITAGSGFAPVATDHFYPMVRGCTTDPYRCASIERLLSDERLQNLAYQVFTHAAEAARHGLGYRLQEVNSAAGRGVNGVSNVAASAVWGIAAMFEAACPQPPNAPGANADCALGAAGVSFHNAEVRAFFYPQEGNAYYNAIDYDPSDAAGAPTAAPLYYAQLLFARFAQGTRDLRPLAVAADPAVGAQVRAWQVDAGESQRRLFVANMATSPLTVSLPASGGRYELDRLAPYDPTGAGRTLDAPEVRIDGRAVSADGSWPGFAPTAGRISGGGLQLALGAGEVAVVTLHGR